MKTKTILLVTLTVFIAMLLVETLAHTCFPKLLFSGSWLVPLYYWLFYVVASCMVTPSMSGAEFTRFILGLKGAKIFISMMYAVAVAFFMRDSVVALVLNLILYYLLLLVPECVYCMHMKKHIK